MALAAAQELHQRMMQLPPRGSTGIICCQCNGLNHFDKDYKSLINRGGKPHICCYNCNKIGPILSGKWARGLHLGTCFLPSQDVDSVCPTVEINVGKEVHHVSRLQVLPHHIEQKGVPNVGETKLWHHNLSSATRTCGIRLISLHVGNGQVVVMEALVFVFLIGTDTIKALCEMSISKSGVSMYPRASFFVCGGTSTLDWRTWFWGGIWSAVEWVGCILEIGRRQKLQNHVTEYSVLTKIGIVWEGVATMDWEGLVYSIWRAEAWTSKRATSTNGWCAAKQDESMSCNGLQITQSPCQCIHCRHWCLHHQTKSMTTQRIECYPARSQISLSTSVHQWTTLAITNCYLPRQKVLPDQIGIWAECPPPSKMRSIIDAMISQDEKNQRRQPQHTLTTCT